MRLEEIVRTGLSRLDVVRVRTAINPLLWLVGLTTPLCLIAMIAIPDQSIRLALLGFAALPIIFTIAAYITFMLRDPDRLQSEEYRIRQHAIQLLYRKGGTTEIVDVVNQAPRVELDVRSRRETEP